MDRRSALVAALTVCVALAGCNLPADGPVTGTETTPAADATPPGAVTTDGTATTATATGTTTTTPSGPPNVTVQNGTLPVDAGRVFADVLAVLGHDGRAPAYVRVVSNRSNLSVGVERRVPPFFELVGVTPAEPNATLALENGFTSALGDVVLFVPDGTAPGRVAALLAHEYVHYLQFQRGRASALNRALGETGTGTATTDRRFVVRATLEGVAVYATDAYAERYRPDGESNSALYDRFGRLFPAGSFQRYGTRQYVAGREYVAARFDDPAAADAVYDDPPRTGEQVLHPGVEEPPRPLGVRVDAPGHRRAGRDTLGEAFVRTALAGDVAASEARTAATGWGNDTLVGLRPRSGAPRQKNYAWVLRWDDAANASAFAGAARTALAAPGGDRNGNGENESQSGDGNHDPRRLGDVSAGLYRSGDVTVLLVGDRSFVEGTRIDVEGPTVRIRGPDAGGPSGR